MAQQRRALWAAEEIDEDVDLSLAIEDYAQNGLYDDGDHRVLLIVQVSTLNVFR
jgi:hypothetical protein